MKTQSDWRREGDAQVARRRYRGSAETLPLLGFGLMRLPQKDGRIDRVVAQTMVDRAMRAGCNYFDTAYMYHDGESEKFVGEALAKYPRDSYYLIPICHHKVCNPLVLAAIKFGLIHCRYLW